MLGKYRREMSHYLMVNEFINKSYTNTSEPVQVVEVGPSLVRVSYYKETDQSLWG